MPKSSPSLDTLPPAAADSLRRLGENLAIARVRRKESQRSWAQRLGVSVPTLIRLERGDAAVSAGIYATALWLIGRAAGLAELAAPAEDRGALEGEVRAAVQRRAVRSQASVKARLGRSAKGGAHTENAKRSAATDSSDRGNTKHSHSKNNHNKNSPSKSSSKTTQGTAPRRRSKTG